MTLENLKAELKTLSPDAKKVLLALLSSDVLSSESSEKFTSNISNSVKCPHCGKYHIVKRGVRANKQKYFCMDCGKWFSTQTKSVFWNTKKPIELWFQYIECMVKGLSLPKTAVKLGICVTTAFYWRHKIMAAMLTMKAPELGGIVEADETYFCVSHKGSKTLPEGTARKRGPKSKNFGEKHKRGLSTEKVCVLTALDRDGHYFNDPVGYGKVQKTWVKKTLSPQIKRDSTLVTDGDKSYRALAKVKLIQITGGITKNKVFNIYRIGAYHKHLKDWMVKFNGVATKYLDHYVNFYKAIKVETLKFDNLIAIDNYCRWKDVDEKEEFKRVEYKRAA